MDQGKCDSLKAELANQNEPQVVSIERFFDGNDDEGSIGCNLAKHPGIEKFRATLVGLLKRPDVEAVYAQIAELDPGEESWPFADTVWVVGKISSKDLMKATASLKPTEAGRADGFPAPDALAHHESPLSLLWWD